MIDQPTCDGPSGIFSIFWFHQAQGIDVLRSLISPMGADGLGWLGCIWMEEPGVFGSKIRFSINVNLAKTSVRLFNSQMPSICVESEDRFHYASVSHWIMACFCSDVCRRLSSLCEETLTRFAERERERDQSHAQDHHEVCVPN